MAAIYYVNQWSAVLNICTNCKRSVCFLHQNYLISRIHGCKNILKPKVKMICLLFLLMALNDSGQGWRKVQKNAGPPWLDVIKLRLTSSYWIILFIAVAKNGGPLPAPLPPDFAAPHIFWENMITLKRVLQIYH